MVLLAIYRKTKAYHLLLLLLCSILLGALTGYKMGSDATQLKPFGDVFLNLLFTFIGPLIFFSVSSAVASIPRLKTMWKMFMGMMGVYVFTGIIAALLMIVAVLVFPPAKGVNLPLLSSIKIQPLHLADEITSMFTAPDFSALFSRNSTLSLILFAFLVGLAASGLGERAKPFTRFLQSGMDVFMKAVTYVMYYAPIGFFAYFAVLVGELGPKLIETYYRSAAIYYGTGLFYFVVAFTFYAYLAKKREGVKRLAKHISMPAITALATCSSAASLPANLLAAQRIGVPAQIVEFTLPLGTIIHKDGSIMGGILKIAFLFGIFHLSFSGLSVLLTALIISLLVGTVMGAIPSGGMVGEMLILSVYGFPPQTLMMIAAISIIIDPLATMLNVTSNTVCSMLIARVTEKRK